MKPRPITIVQGAQWGSEAKGAVAAWICRNEGVDIAVRTGATNAGHTAYYEGRAIKFQQLPVAALQPDVSLILGAGALIDPDILGREVELVDSLVGGSVRDRLKVDRRAGLHLRVHADRSAESGRHQMMGATGKGCSEALIDRIKGRGLLAQPFGGTEYASDYEICDTEAYLNYAWMEGSKILLEGTQGQLLDLYLGPYPYVTHKQTGPAQWMLECGLSPALPTDIVSVVRTFPIRVAGNSGPMPQEISWPILVREMNEIRDRHMQSHLVDEHSIAEWEETVRQVSTKFKLPSGSDGLDQHTWSPAERVFYRIALSDLHAEAWNFVRPQVKADLMKVFELTTVTKKLRRVARLDRESLIASSRQMRPHRVALTFMNYLFPNYWGMVPPVWTNDQAEFIRQVEEWSGAPVDLINYGPEDHHMIRVRLGLTVAGAV